MAELRVGMKAGQWVDWMVVGLVEWTALTKAALKASPKVASKVGMKAWT